MSFSETSAESIAAAAAEAYRRAGVQGLSCLDQIPLAAYATDPDGVIIYFNPASVPFAGRAPKLREDRWCVTWKLFTHDGEFLPHDQCPMAVAVRSQQMVRGVSAVAERPDGQRIAFAPYPTPAIASDGAFLGAINVLADITDTFVATCEAKAERARRVARLLGEDRALTNLEALAREYERKIAFVRRSAN